MAGGASRYPRRQATLSTEQFLCYNPAAMTNIPEQVLQDVASRVARRVASGADESAPAMPARYTLLVLSGEGSDLAAALDRVAAEGDAVVVADCPAGTAGALATALARLPRAHPVSGEVAYDSGRLVAGAGLVLAPSMNLALASRVAAMQADTPAAAAILRALLSGVSVEASLDDRDFTVAPEASDGARRALEEIVTRLKALGVALERPRAAAAVAAPAGIHPSQERFELSDPLNEFLDYLEKRPCLIEQGKPCVGCGACETRGF